MSEEISLGGSPVALPVEGDKTFIVAVSQKASTAYVKQVAANLDVKKVDKSVYDAKIALIDAALGEGEGNLGGRVSTLEGKVDTINGDASTAGSIAAAVAAEAALRVAADNELDARLDVIEGDANTSGSIAEEASLRAAADDALDGRLDTVEAALGTLTAAGSVESAISAAQTAATDYTDAREVILQGNIDRKADAATTYSKTEVDNAIAAAAASVFKYKGTKDSLAALQATATGNVVGDVWHVANAGTNGAGAEYVCTAVNAETGIGTWEELGTAVDLSAYSTTVNMNSAIAAAVLVEENRAKGVEGALDTRLGTAEGEIDALQAALGTLTAAGSVEAAISTAQSAAVTSAGTAADSKIATAIGNLTVNAKGFSNNAIVLDGSDVALGASYVAGQNDVIALTSASTITGAFSSVVSHLNTLDASTGGNSAALTQAQTDIDALEAALPISQFNGTNTVKAALDTKVDKVTGSSLIPTTKIEKLDALPTNAQLNDLLAAKVDKQPTVAGASVAMEAGKRYVVNGAFAGTLPASAANGAIVEIYVLTGGSNRLVSAATGDTILGQNLPCAIGISEEGWVLNNEVYTFIYDSANSNWHVL